MGRGSAEADPQDETPVVAGGRYVLRAWRRSLGARFCVTHIIALRYQKGHKTMVNPETEERILSPGASRTGNYGGVRWGSGERRLNGSSKVIVNRKVTADGDRA